LSAEIRSVAGVSGLSTPELRVLGCLLEKQRTTPDAYPLSLNALRLACNQSTNRDPVVDYDEASVREALHRLERRRLVRLASGAGSRASKYRHLLAETLPIDAREQALLSVLMLRGPQTPGELKQRAERMHPFADLAAVQDTLSRLIERGLAVRLERRPGQKEERYAQLLDEQDRPGEEEGASAVAPAAVDARADSPGDLVEQLSARVQQLERRVAELAATMRHPSEAPIPEVPVRPADDDSRFDPRL
jgi:uncharacterized protein YceH (UPF0502 family)